MSKSNIKTIDPSNVETRVLHKYLLSAIAPRPIAFASTINSAGQVNLSPFSYFNVFSINPPICVFSPSRRGRDGSTKDTLENIKQVPEVVINIVNYPIIEQMSLSSTEYETGVNEFTKSGLTEVPSNVVKPPRVKESPVALECTVDKVIELGEEGGAGNLILARVKLVHIQEEYLNEDGFIDSLKMDLVARMGDSWYCRANEQSMFEIPKPGRNRGIGVDALPEQIRMSEILTGNDLGKLGNLESMPTPEEINSIKESDEVKEIYDRLTLDKEIETELHRLGKKMIERGEISEALAVMMSNRIIKEKN
ncbi:MAG: flavin reductase family protein [Balneolaceae bacterium]